MESQEKNSVEKSNLITTEQSAFSLSLLQAGLYAPLNKLLGKKEIDKIDETGKYKGKSYPFSYIFSPNDRRNNEILANAKKGDILNIYSQNGKLTKQGTIVVDEIFQIDKRKRVEKIFGSYDMTNPDIRKYLKSLGQYCVSGELNMNLNRIQALMTKIKRAKNLAKAKDITALLIKNTPVNRAHERLIRNAVEKSEFLLIINIGDLEQDDSEFELNLRLLKTFVNTYIKKNKVLVIAQKRAQISTINKYIVRDAINARNFGCKELMLRMEDVNVGLHIESGEQKTIFDEYEDLGIKINIIDEIVACSDCRMIVKKSTCPHGSHRHIRYDDGAIRELLGEGIIPPSIIMRPSISSQYLAHTMPNRFAYLQKIYDNLIPTKNGILQEHSEASLYEQIAKLHKVSF